MITVADIENLIKDRESRTIEYKQSIAELDKLGKAICGFLNGHGGFGLIGITDKRKIIGIEVTESTKNKLSEFCNKFEPWPDLEISYVDINEKGKKVVVLNAKPGIDRHPFSFKGVPYLRNEAQIKKMPMETFKQRLLSSSGISKRWEILPANKKYSVSDLNEDEILETIKLAIEKKRLPIKAETKNPHDALITLELINESGELTNAAMVLFSKSKLSDYDHCLIRMARFRDESMNETIDSQQVCGNAFYLLEEAENFVQKHLPISSRYSPSQMQRIDEPALPFLAIREAIINAIVHRDYSDYTGDVSLFIFNTHFEIHNIGHLYGNMTIDKLKVRHSSRRRNSKIANVFYLRELIERYGSGTLRMIELCEKHGLKPPEFSEAGDGFLVKFYFKTPIGPDRLIVSESSTAYLTDRQLRILNILASLNTPLPLREIVHKLNHEAASRTIGDDLAYLKSMKLVDSEGVGKGARWFLIENPKKMI